MTRPKTVTRNDPNILVIIVDQLRFPQGEFDQALMDEAAPNLAKLRRESVNFKRHYAAATACSPSRSTMLTGLYTHQNGMFLTNVEGLLDQPPSPDLNPGFPTWGSVLQGDYGYRTYWWGKWHLSLDCDYEPYGFQRIGLPCPSPNGAPGEGLDVDPEIADLFIDWLRDQDRRDQDGRDQDRCDEDRHHTADHKRRPWCTTVSLVNPHDIQWYPKYTPSVPGEARPPRIPEFHKGLPRNWERWPEALFDEHKPAAQAAWALICEAVFGAMRYRGRGFEESWFELLDLYYLCTQYVDRQIGRVLRALERSGYADDTIVIFTADHGEYGGAHGLRGKAFGVYEESTRVPLYVKDPTGQWVPPDQIGTEREELTSHVDLLPLLLTIASGGNAWRQRPRYAQWADRADLARLLWDPHANGRPYVLHTSDEDIPEEGPRLGIPYRDVLVRRERLPYPAERRGIPTHVIGYRTKHDKLGVYSHWRPGTIQIERAGQQYELYDYVRYGRGEVKNNAPGAPHPEPELFAERYRDLFDPRRGAIATELRKPLPRFLRPVQRQAIQAYLDFQASAGAE